MQMPNVRDFVSGKNIVPLHSEIRRRKASPPALPRREGAGRRQDLVENQKSQAFIISNKRNYEQDKTNANV